jgi:2-alkyl-3-oxoalkanoate reductase
MKVLVTGGGGFLGGGIVRASLERGDSVRSFSRNHYPELAKLGIELFRGDLADPEAIDLAVRGCNVVFHVAAKVDIVGPYEEFYRSNVLGTRHVIAACLNHKVRRLVYTSSPSVIFNDTDMEGVDESVPYPDHYDAHYPKTKALAEQEVLRANSPDLATVVLRPHLIWGPGDTNLIPRILRRGKKGGLWKVGKKPKLVDTVYIDNAVAAHLQAADRLSPGSSVAGKVYFISQGDPRPVWDLINAILKAVALRPVNRTISPKLALAAGWLLERMHNVLSLKGEPRLTPFLVKELTNAHWFDISAAHRDFGYKPKITMEEGIRRMEQWLACEVKENKLWTF